MKITKSQLQQIIKEELESVLTEQEERAEIGGDEVDEFRPRPTYTEDVPEWFKGEGKVAEKLNQMRDLLFESIDQLEKRIEALEPESEPEPEPGPAITTGGGFTPQ